MSHRSLVFAGLVSLACLSPSAAFGQEWPVIGSPNTVTPEPTVPYLPAESCIVELFGNVAFADFSPKPFSYAPPARCPGPWSKVVLQADWSITAGVQYDRTANVWLGGVNVFFGTTAEPSSEVARSWHVERDLTSYATLFRSAQAGSADLGNLVNSTYTSVLYGSARLLFYPAGPTATGALTELTRPADLVIPISAGATGGTVAITSGAPLSRVVTLPRNVERMVLDVVAQSQASDEFWYTCVPDDQANNLQSCGGTAFRETDVSLDGQPAGISPVYPWIYTGGIDPFLWAPIPGVRTLSFEPYRVELSPFAGTVNDGASHTVTLDVVNANDNFATTATLLVWLDPGGEQVTGGVTSNTLTAAPTPVVTEDLATAPDGSITGTIDVTSARKLTIAGWVKTSHGVVDTQVTQSINFGNLQSFVINASTYQQDITQGTTISSETVTSEPQGRYTRTRSESWPLSVGIAAVTASDGSSSQTTTIRQELLRDTQALWGIAVVDQEHLDIVASPHDTLLFDASGDFLGNTAQVGAISYVSSDLGVPYCRGLYALGGLLHMDQDTCWP